jgi:hypothetical protein
MAANKSSRRPRSPVSPPNPSVAARQVSLSELSLRTAVIRLRDARSVATTAVIALVHYAGLRTMPSEMNRARCAAMKSGV